MEHQPVRKSRKIWWGIVAVGFVAVIILGVSGSSSAAPVTSSTTNILSESAPAAQVSQGSELSNNNYYENVSGNEVHSPAYSDDGAVPVGATAQCRDTTYSFSQHRSGTCSGHGGVAIWE